MKTVPTPGKFYFLSFFIVILPILANANKKISAANVAARNTSRHMAKKKTGHFWHMEEKRSSHMAGMKTSHFWHKTKRKATFSLRRAERRMIALEAAEMFDQMQLQDSGMNEKALLYALLGYHRLLKRHLLRKTQVLSICDFSQSSGSKRMYVIDVRNKRVLYRTYVAHGINSGQEYACAFSNTPQSCKSSLGFFVTRSAYFGSNGLSLRIDGLEKGFNDKAKQRNIVIHGAPYVSERILHKYGVMGTTFGCPAIPTDMAAQVIPVLKNGTCFFVYYPSRRYLSGSSVLNG
jgi:hypothetical protein